MTIGVLYTSTVYGVVWTIQIYEYRSLMNLYLLIPIAVFVLIVARTIAITVRVHMLDADRSMKFESNSILAHLSYYMA